mmetsp:Transcript_15738/g.17377  ORF Transcript_15738/g.17377 Transcript_15738/m.17377 type:complete len:118 (+) Transcript_15738:69-422(+)
MSPTNNESQFQIQSQQQIGVVPINIKKVEALTLTDCLLSQYRLCAVGIGSGTVYTLKYKKGLIPMIAAGAVGTTADLVYGYLVECAHLTNNETTTTTNTNTNTNTTTATTTIDTRTD